MIKAILAVVAMQTCLILFLLSDRTTPVGRPETHPQRSFVSSSSDGLSSEVLLSEQALRRILREELADHVDRLLLERETAMDTETMTQARLGMPDTPDEPPPTDPYEAEYVSQQIDYFESVGTITSTEMTRLQSDIARLTGAERERLLRKLVAALNSGRLKGRL